MRRRGLPFYFQYTITGYGEAIERAVLPAARSVEAVRRIVDAHGPRSVVWRYDPVVVTQSMPIGWHVENFSSLAVQLAGYADEAATKFLVVHAKTRRNLTAAIGKTWSNPNLDAMARLLSQFNQIASTHGMRLTLCSQPEIPVDLPHSVCIDAARLNAHGAWIQSARTLGNRPGCLCIEARDIGDYDTCPQGCAYCYATQHQNLAIRRHRLHDPNAESLIPMQCPQKPPRVRSANLFES